MSTIGQRIKEIRQELRLSQEQFGQIFCAGKSYISAVENDKSKLSVENLVKLLVDYNVSIDYILGGIGKPFITQQYNAVKSELRSEVLQILKDEGIIK